MEKKVVLCILVGIMLTVAGCSVKSSKNLDLSEDEEEMIELIGDDVNAVSKDDFVTVISDITENPEDYTGKVYEFDGMYTTTDSEDGDKPYLYQMVDDEKLGIQMRYATKEVDEGEWIHVTGVISVEEHDGHSHTFLDVVAMESSEG